MWTVNGAKKWLKEHNYIQMKPVDITKNFYRFRVKWPIKGYRYRIIEFGDGIKAIVMFK